MLHYFAYGSNLHPVRLMQRVPSAELVGTVKLTHYRLGFHKKSSDGSSKCSISNTGSESGLVYGAIYKLDPEHKIELDKFEGKGYGYIDSLINLVQGEKEYSCFTYLAQQSHMVINLKPYHWYKQLVVLGAKYLQFPDLYISSIDSIESMEDPDTKRRKEKEALIESIIQYR